MFDQPSLFERHAAAKPIILRPYQQAAVDAVYEHLRARQDNPCVVLPTGAGKTPVIARICGDAVKQWSGRVLVLAHVKELLQQAADKLRAMCPGIPVGLYSAGLGRRDVRQPIIVAGIQSIFRKACDIDPFDLVLVDEAHLIPPDGEGMYQQFLADAKVVNPNLRIVGLTATPFRMKSGSICTPEGMLNHICYEVGVRELIVDGFLSPLISKSGQAKVDTSKLSIRAGEFVAEEAEALMDVDEIVTQACGEIADYTAERKSCLIFACGVQHAQHIAAAIELATAQQCGIVTGETPDGERARILARFVDGELKYLANVNVLTTGFDATNIDCVALLRPTMSPGLYYQMVGRGFRLHPGKENCLVLDFGGNVLRHGPVDRIEVKDASKRKKRDQGDSPAKECPKCASLIAAGYSVCPDCGHEFEVEEKQPHESRATEAGILSGQVTSCVRAVERTFYTLHRKKGALDTDPRTLRVDYVSAGGFHTQSEWVCLEHAEGSFPQRKAAAWWQARSPDPIPTSIEAAVEIAEGGGLCETLEITVRSVAGDKFDRIVDYKLGAKPEPLPAGSGGRLSTVAFDDDIPF